MTLLTTCTSLAEDIQSHLEIDETALTIGCNLSQAEGIAKAFERHHIEMPPYRLFIVVLGNAIEHTAPNPIKSTCFVFKLAHMLYHMVEACAEVDGETCAKH